VCALVLCLTCRDMRKSHRISDDAEARLPELAALTKNFSGAEIEGLCRSAASFAFARCINTKDVRHRWIRC
jgi:vesicle-fusing ATPase